MVAGRKPDSPKVRDLSEGRFTVVDGGGGEQLAPTADDLAPPDWITDELARDEWRRVLPELRARKQYIPLFSTELGRYCVAFAQYVRALQAMEKPQGRKKQAQGPVVLSSKNVQMVSMHWVVANRAQEIMHKLAADLGFNPVAQVRLSGMQLDLFTQPRSTGTDGGPATPSTGFGQFRRP